MASSHGDRTAVEDATLGGSSEIIALITEFEQSIALDGQLDHALDFNNLLTGLIGNIDLAETYLEKGTEPCELLAEAQRAAFRATTLTRQLLTFAKGEGAAAKSHRRHSTRQRRRRARVSRKQRALPVRASEGPSIRHG